ncbi:MAG: helix-turn-helix domain-containing protein [Firmicutes bacterium]|nr:helix-turn-helix domain-containing protein [Bacillota bacterium]
MLTRLKEIRKEMGLTQIQLSLISGVSQNQISRFEKGQSINDENIVLLCKALNVTADYFLRMSDKK